MNEHSTPNEPSAQPKTDDSDDRSTDRALFEWVSRLFGVSLGFVYLVGFLVVMRHLSRYGVSSFSIFQLQYLVAGVWVVAPIVVLRFMQIASQRFVDRALSVDREAERISWRRRAIVASAAAIPGGLVIASMAIFAGNPEGFSLRISALLYLFYLALAWSADLLRLSRKAPAHLAQKWWASSHTSLFYASSLVSIFLLYVIFFAIQVYPLIPYSLGGGKPLTVVFLLGEKEVPDILARDKSSHRSVPYKLLAATDKTFVILPTDHNQQSIEFNRDSVLGVVVLRDSPSQ